MEEGDITPNAVHDQDLTVYIIVNNDLKMSEGKIHSQVGHAIVGLILFHLREEKGHMEKLQNWVGKGERIISLQGSSKDFGKIKKDFQGTGLYCNEIRDAGLTEVGPGSKTVFIIGPGDIKTLSTYFKDYSLY